MNQQVINALFAQIEKLSPVDWAEKYRYLPKKTSNFDGPMSYDLTPYLRKIANCIMADNPAQIISIMKSSQIGFSIGGLFSMLGWIISQSQANTLFITETDKKVKQQMNGPISEMINNSDIKDLVGNNNIRDFRDTRSKRNSSSGDTSEGLEFGDGTLYTWSGQNIGNLSSWSIKYGIYDEIERWKGNYSNAGDFLGLVEPRHKSFEADMKMVFGSTPETDDDSNIKPLYKKGNQEKYHIPCKECGTEITLEWDTEVNGERAGVIYERDKNGKFIENSARYKCQVCGGVWKQKHVYQMYDEENIAQRAIDNGQNTVHVCDWKATSEPENWRYQSFHINALYSPEGFFDWNKYAREWTEITPINAPPKIGAMQTFINQTLGDTFKIKTKEPKASNLQKNIRGYQIGVVPDALSIDDGNGPIVLITLAVDLNGTMGKTVEEDDVRLDYEIRAWSMKGDEDYVVSYSVDHGSIGTFERSHIRKAKERNSTKADKRTKWTYRHNQENSVWTELENIIKTPLQTDDGKRMHIGICGVDTGNYTVYANKFVANNAISYAIKGKSDKDSTRTDKDMPYFKKGTKHKLFIVEGDLLKDVLAESMELRADVDNGDEQQNGFINFPTSDGKKYTYDTYFKEYEGEKRQVYYDNNKKVKGIRWKKKYDSAPNHFFDTAYYNSALQKITTFLVCKENKVDVSWENFCNLILKM